MKIRIWINLIPKIRVKLHVRNYTFVKGYIYLYITFDNHFANFFNKCDKNL